MEAAVSAAVEDIVPKDSWRKNRHKAIIESVSFNTECSCHASCIYSRRVSLGAVVVRIAPDNIPYDGDVPDSTIRI